MNGKHLRVRHPRVRQTLAIGIGVLLCGCTIRPKEVAEEFLGALSERDLRAAGKFCDPELRDRLREFTAAERGFQYGVERFDWRLRDMGPTRDGGMAVVAQFHAVRQWPVPPEVQGMVRLNMHKRGGRWMITDGTVAIDRYIELVTNPVNGARIVLPQVGAPRWERIESINEPLAAFARRYDEYCASWVR
jgi:hypothetical protein